MIASRSAIESYVVAVTAEVEDPALPVLLTDGSKFVPTKRLVAYKLDLVRDVPNDRLLVARQETFEILQTKARMTSGWHVFATTTEGTLLARDGRGHVVSGDPQQYDRPSYFDPLALGIAFQGEYQNGGSWKKITDHYLGWPDNLRATALENGLIRYASRTYEADVDVQRNSWPVRMTYNGDAGTFATTLELGQVADQWLPQVAKINLPDGGDLRLKLEWSSVNKPVSSYFTRAEIQQRYGIALE